jgi:hypothetical protein
MAPMQERDRGQGGPRAISEISQRLTRAPLGRRGFAQASLITDWAAIVGDRQALGSLPLKISFGAGERSAGILHVRVATGGLAVEFRHREPLILQRINSHFGYQAVARLTLSQGPMPPRAPHRRGPSPPAPDPARQRQLDASLQQVEDDELRRALARLGGVIL